MTTATISPINPLALPELWLLKLKVKSSSKFDLALADVQAYAHDKWLPGRHIVLAGYSPAARTIQVLFTRYADLDYVTGDLTIHDPSIGAYHRLSAAWAYHVTNDADCKCTPCQEGGLDLLFNNRNNNPGGWKSQVI